MNNIIQKIEKHIKQNSSSLWPHLVSTKNLAIEIAKIYNVDLYKTEVASLGHDILRYLAKDKVLKLVEENKNKLKEFINPPLPYILYHGPLASILFPKLFNYEDPEVLKAIRYHSIISKNPSNLEAIIFISDKLEPTKNRPNRLNILDLVFQGKLYEGLNILIKTQVDYLKTKGLAPHPYLLFHLEGPS